MCGIAGFYTKKNNLNFIDILDRMSSVIIHRGPDDSGMKIINTESNGVIGFAFRRLSILDLSINGRQPMESESGLITIMFNGEIYNYRELRDELIKDGFTFRSHTDTEVIIKLYQKHGEKCLMFLNGMFAFVIYDQERDILFIARDRLGVKPFYYHHDNDNFVFASEVKSLIQHPGVKCKVNYRAIGEYLHSRYVKNPQTIFEGIKKLQPGHYMVLTNNNIKIKKYWDIEYNKKKYNNIGQAVENLNSLLKDSTLLRLVSDVPIGVFLSGGIDSSLIVSMMSKISPFHLKTFSVGLNDENLSEVKFAREVASLFETDHKELIITHKDFVEHLYKVVWYRDAPVSEASDIPIFLLSRMAKKDVSVILTGEGSDELFAGYPKYFYDKFADNLLFRYLFLNGPVFYMINKLINHRRKVKHALNILRERNYCTRLNGWFSSFDGKNLEDILSDDYKESYDLSHGAAQLKGLTKLDKMLYRDIKFWLTDNLLERGDKMLMASSIEGRYPFLDYRIAEFSSELSDKCKMKLNNRKYVVKKLAEEYLPRRIIYRKKVGFYIPVGEWFKSDLKDFVCDHLLSADFYARGIFNRDRVANILDLHFKSTHDYEKEIWTLLNLEIWFKVFIDSQNGKIS